MVCKPNEIGGLGIVNFQKQNASLLIKFFDKFYNQAEIMGTINLACSL
jgi:hypothetical protein